MTVTELGSVEITGARRIETTAVFESAVPAVLVTRAQYLAGAVSGGVVNDAAVAPSTGFPVTPESPAYHWKVGEAPAAATLKVAVPPLLTKVEPGSSVMIGAAITVAVTVDESALPAALDARTQ